MTTDQNIVLVTGASGYLGSHVVAKALEAGYAVKATARGHKADLLRKFYASSNKPNVEIISVQDVATHDFENTLKGVYAVIHVASPLPSGAQPNEMFETAVKGTLNVVEQAERAGVRRVVVTSSLSTVLNSNGTFKNEDWNTLTKEAAVTSGNPSSVYVASKIAAERALWEWAEDHPHVEVTTVLPSIMYGPFTQAFVSAVVKPSFYAISTQLVLYHLINPDGLYHSHLTAMGAVDVRDVALIHVRAINSPSSQQAGKKRIVVSGPYAYDPLGARTLLLKERSGLKERIIKEPLLNQQDLEFPHVDYGRIEELTGFKESQYTHIDKVILDGIDSLLELEKSWTDAGYALPDLVPWANSGETASGGPQSNLDHVIG